jgi:bacillithiol biosynthesis deacetylase BshB1
MILFETRILVTAQLDVLVVAPHPDDAEISTGGMLLVSKQSGMKVGVVELTNGEPTPHGTPEIRRRETAKATEILQLDYRENLHLPNRSLEANLDARRKLAEVFRRTRPKIIFAPYWEDAHPDHVSASQLVDAARFWSKLTKTDMEGEPYWPPRILYFWSIHLRIHPKPAFILDISSVIDEKMLAVAAYESQFTIGRPQIFPTALDDIRDRARYWGWTIARGYGEAFASREDIGLASLNALL